MGSDIPFVSCTVGWESCRVDGDYKHGANSGKIEINGVIYSKGFVAHAAGAATFSIDGSYTKLSTCIGISPIASDARCGVTVGDARFRILGNANVLQDWIVKGSPEAATCLEVDINGVTNLVLETDLNGTRDCDISTWADAKIYKA